MGGSRGGGGDRGSRSPSVFQHIGFCNGIIFGITPGLKLIPEPWETMRLHADDSKENRTNLLAWTLNIGYHRWRNYRGGFFMVSCVTRCANEKPEEQWSCKRSLDQPLVIIWTNYDGPMSKMLHTKFQGNRSTGTGREDFWRGFTIYRCGSHLGHVSSIMLINFHFHIPKSLQTKFCKKWPSAFCKNQVFIFICKWPWAKVKKWHQVDFEKLYTLIYSVSCLHLTT